jgi:Asp-tRNA(Asn)/Glu-tRNA(Gln) amidotransferase A subunit family amidase
VVTEGFGIPGLSQPEVDATVRAAIARLGEAGLEIGEVSVPWHSVDSYQARHYAMARNLVPQVRGAYDEALASFDVLVMPTLPIVATPLVTPSDPRETYLARALEMIPNTAPFDVSGHPATSVPAGLAGGLPAGLMIVGRHFEDTACLRVAQAFETLTGGFPAPGFLPGTGQIGDPGMDGT